MRLTRYFTILFLIAAVVQSCSVTKHLPPNETLYMGAEVKVTDPDMRSKEKKAIKEEMEALTRPIPNKRILGVPFKLMMYNLAGNPKKQTSLLGKLKYKIGEAPVLGSTVNIDYNVKVLQSTLENKGYFNNFVTGDSTVKNKKARAQYSIQAGKRYTLQSIQLQKDSSAVHTQIAASLKNTLLKPGDYFNLSVIKLERERIDAYLKERGYYYFDPNFILIEADSTIGNNQVDLNILLKRNTPANAKIAYTINDVYIYPGYGLQAGVGDTSKRNAEFYEGYYLVDKRKRYKPRMFRQTMQFLPGDLYNRKDQNQSISRLINLGVFKFVKNNFIPVTVDDSAKLNVYYYLTSLPKKAIRLDVNANTKSNNLTGSAIAVSWHNRNTFRGGELLSVNATGGFELQFGGQLKGYNTYRGGLETKLVFPRFVVPFVKVNTRGGFVPKTNMSLAYDLLSKEKLYIMNSFRAEYGYAWKETITKEHILNLLSVNYVQPLRITQQYQDSIVTNPTLAKAVEKQFILGSNYNYNYNQSATTSVLKGLYFNGNLDLSGNIAGLITGASKNNSGNPKTIFGAAFSQYVKVETDLRYYVHVSKKTTWANRLIVGVGYPYGNSSELPFIKQFFAGGNNDIRAFRSRSLGPGAYNYDRNSNVLPDQSGDIKLEVNTELRAKLFSIVHGALFVDAGNIWLYNNNPNKPGAKFSNQFLKELAVGTGAGVRFDISFLVLRLDVAFPLRKPWLPEADRWVIDAINFGSGRWRSDNLVYNIGIGYPF